jgi:hypothetical protein
MRIDGTRTAQGPQDTGVLLAAISCPDLIGASVLTVTGAVPKPYVRSQNESDRLHLALDAIQGRDLADEECRPYVSGHHQVRERQERLRVDLRHGLVSAAPDRVHQARGTRCLVTANKPPFGGMTYQPSCRVRTVTDRASHKTLGPTSPFDLVGAQGPLFGHTARSILNQL